MTKLIVGCGYLGIRVAKAWREMGHRVCALTRSRLNADRLRSVGIEPILGDILQPESLTALPEAKTLLYAVGFDRASGYTRRQVYVEGLENVLNVMAGRSDRLIYISSSSVYGQQDGQWVDETSPCEPKQPNGQICLEAESIVWEHASATPNSRRPKVNVLRLSGIYGPGRLLARIEQLRAGTPLSGNPDAYLNLIHVDDAARAVMACEFRGGCRSTYLVSDDQPIRRREYYSTLAQLTGAPPPQFAIVHDRQGAAGPNKRCRNTALHQELCLDLLYSTISTGLPHAIAG